MRIQGNARQNALQGLQRAEKSFEKSAKRISETLLPSTDQNQGTWIEDQVDLSDPNQPRSQDQYAKPPAKFYSIADDAVQMKMSAFAYRSNLMVIKMNNDLDRSVLDLSKKTE
jgi:hypothetical protein